MISIESAFQAYLDGTFGPWDLQEVVEWHGFEGWTCTPDSKLIVHYKVSK